MKRNPMARVLRDPRCSGAYTSKTIPNKKRDVKRVNAKKILKDSQPNLI